MLSGGFATRLTKSANLYHKQTWVPAVREVTWSNHLSPEANLNALEEAKRAALGPPPTSTLTSHWRERAEDVVWAIVNAPELQFLP